MDAKPGRAGPDAGIWALAAAAIGLGAAGLAFQAFPLQDRPIPADLPARAALATVVSLALAGAGTMLLFPRLRRFGAPLLALLYALWILVVQLPGTLAMPRILGMWLGPAELMTLVIAGLLLIRATRRDAVETGARILFGICLIVFGACHFVYDQITAAMVPGWLPGSYFWAYATGAGHILAGLALASGMLGRLAVTLWTAMCASFVLLVHLPRVSAQPGVHAEWAMLFLALSMGGSGWIIRSLASNALPFGLLSGRAHPTPAV